MPCASRYRNKKHSINYTWHICHVINCKIMRRLKKHEKSRYKEAMKFAPLKQQIIVIWWDIFCPKKREKFHTCIMSGMHWKAAFKDAENKE